MVLSACPDASSKSSRTKGAVSCRIMIGRDLVGQMTMVKLDIDPHLIALGDPFRSRREGSMLPC